MFGKEKMYLGSFCRGLCSEVIQMPYLSYDRYLEADEHGVLSEKEYNAFNSMIPGFRLMLIYAGITQKSLEGKIKIENEEIGRTFSTALGMAYQDNNYTKEEAAEKLESFLVSIEEYSDYLQTVDDEMIMKEGLMFFVCMYYSDKFGTLIDKNDVKKWATLVTITNNNKNIIKQYFEDTYKKVKIVD